MLDMARCVFALLVLFSFAPIASAQQPRITLGGAVTVVTQPHSSEEPLGGTSVGGSVLFGVRVSPRVSIEVEPTVAGELSSDYTYRPSPSLVATVVASRRDLFVPVQARIHLGVFEPIAGVGIVRSNIARHATIGHTSYFDDERSDNDLALVGGFDLVVRLAANVYLVPTFRARVVPQRADSSFDPLGEQTRTGMLNLRYGLGARVAF